MADLVRVRVEETGAEVTVGRAFAESTDGLEVLDVPATNARGVALPESRRNGRPKKRRTTVAEAAASKTSADTSAAKQDTDGGVAAEQPEEAS